jgi:crossover junction endodeoxyribonuclease RuvC
LELWGQSMIVMGVDPGIQTTGYGVIARDEGRSPVLIECGAIHPAAGQPLERRLQEIFEGVSEIIERTRPDALCVEGVFYGRNVKTTVTLGHARGVVILAAALRDIPVTEYPPAEVKNAVVGSGKAGKSQVAFMVQKHLSLAAPPSPSDAADGVAVALCHLFNSGLRGMTGTALRAGVGRKHVD